MDEDFGVQTKMSLRKFILAPKMVVFLNETVNARESCIRGEIPKVKS